MGADLNEGATLLNTLSKNRANGVLYLVASQRLVAETQSEPQIGKKDSFTLSENWANGMVAETQLSRTGHE